MARLRLGPGDVSRIFLPGDAIPDPPPARSLRLVVIGQSATVTPAPTTPDTTRPSNVTGLTATAQDGQIVYGWSAATDNVGVTGYRVYRAGTLVASPVSTTYTLTGLTNGTAVANVTVTAVDAAGNESLTPATFPSATPAVSVTPTTWATNMSNQTVSAAPVDFATVWRAGLSLTVVSDATAPSGKALESLVTGSNARYGVAWEVPGNLGDVEVLTLWKSVGSSGSARTMARIGGAATTETAYTAGSVELLASTAGDYTITRYSGGSFSTLTSLSATISADTWYFTRSRFIGGLIQIKTWAQGSAEPSAWALEFTDTTPITATGQVGWFANIEAARARVGYISAAANGGTAPMLGA